MSGWNDMWDTDQTINVEIAPGDVRSMPIMATATFDSPEFYAGEFAIDLSEITGAQMDYLELWSRDRNLSQRELNVMTVRDMDNSDVVDRLRMDGVLKKLAGTTISFRQLQGLYAKHNNGRQLPAVQQQLSLESAQTRLVKRMTEDTFPRETPGPIPDRSAEIQRIAEEVVESQVGLEIAWVAVIRGGEEIQVGNKVRVSTTLPHGTYARDEWRNVAEDLILALDSAGLAGYSIYNTHANGFTLNKTQPGQ